MMSKPVKWLIRIIISAAVSVMLILIGVTVNQSVINILYTVNGILFSIALSQLVSFSLVEIENDEFVNKQRKQIAYFRKVFILLFSIDTISFLITDLYDDIIFFRCICVVVLLFSLFYDVVNFCDITKVKDEIEDKIRKARKEN